MSSEHLDRKEGALQLRLFAKRLLDITLCLIVAILSLPLLALIAILIAVTSPGPVFFTQGRVGLNQQIFRIIKFRTMTGKSKDKAAQLWTKTEEARVTPVGRFLRDYGLDELPQVFNILQGDMSIIGPRPPLPALVEEFTNSQRKMFQMRPGVLSLAAVEGRRSIPMERRIELHVQYVEEWSLRLDLWILWRSLFVVIGRKDASDSIVG